MGSVSSSESSGSMSESSGSMSKSSGSMSESSGSMSESSGSKSSPESPCACSKTQGKAKTGGAWTNTIYFDPQAGEGNGHSYKFTSDKLLNELSSLVIRGEDIETIIVCKVRLNPLQVTNVLFYHNFILFKTPSGWWTIEKNSEHIVIQTTADMHVKYFFRQKRRDPYDRIDEVIKDSGKKNVEQLIWWLFLENELNEPYNYLFSNCKHFAKAVFNFVALNKQYPSWL